MGLINTIRELLKKKEEPKTQVSQDIDDYIQTEKQKHRIEAIKNFERNDFLYGRGNQNE